MVLEDPDRERRGEKISRTEWEIQKNAGIKMAGREAPVGVCPLWKEECREDHRGKAKNESHKPPRWGGEVQFFRLVEGSSARGPSRIVAEDQSVQ